MNTLRGKFYTGAGGAAFDFIVSDGGREVAATRRADDLARPFAAPATVRNLRDVLELLAAQGAELAAADKAEELRREADALERLRRFEEAETARNAKPAPTP